MQKEVRIVYAYCCLAIKAAGEEDCHHEFCSLHSASYKMFFLATEIGSSLCALEGHAMQLQRQELLVCCWIIQILQENKHILKLLVQNSI